MTRGRSRVMPQVDDFFRGEAILNRDLDNVLAAAIGSVM